MEKFPKAAVTHDSWTSLKNETFSSLTCHVITDDFVLLSCPFDIRKITGHTYYASCIAETVEYGWQKKRSAVYAGTVLCTHTLMHMLYWYACAHPPIPYTGNRLRACHGDSRQEAQRKRMRAIWLPKNANIEQEEQQQTQRQSYTWFFNNSRQRRCHY